MSLQPDHIYLLSMCKWFHKIVLYNLGRSQPAAFEPSLSLQLHKENAEKEVQSDFR